MLIYVVMLIYIYIYILIVWLGPRAHQVMILSGRIDAWKTIGVDAVKPTVAAHLRCRCFSPPHGVQESDHELLTTQRYPEMMCPWWLVGRLQMDTWSS